MKSYQDPDPLHGYGKAVPHPKQPTRYSYRGASLGSGIAVEREQLTTIRASRKVTKAAASGKRFSLAGLLAICANIGRRAARNR